MDIRLQTIKDPDKRMVRTFKKNKEVKESRISTLKPDEIGYLKLLISKKMEWLQKQKVVGTILEVTLPQPIVPNKRFHLH